MDPASSPALAGLLLDGLAPMSAQGVVLPLVALAVLLVLSGLFSGSEVALFSLSPGDREALAEDDTRAARRVLRLLDRPRELLVAILLLNTLVNVGAAILSAQLALALAATSGLSEAALLVLQVVVLTFVLLVVSEIAPKLVASRQPARFATRVAPLLLPLVRLMRPFARALAFATERLQQRFRPDAEPLSSEDIKSMADVGEQQGSLEQEERALIHSIVEFGETTVREVMVSRVDMTALPETATLDEALALIRESGHSRYPLYRDHLDHVLGVVYAKDLLPYVGQNGRAAQLPAGADPDWSALARQPRFVPPSKRLDDLLADFQRTNTHMAIVVDEYGGTAGLVTLEDLLEEVVGDIRDELDSADEERLVRPAGPAGAYHAEARVDLDDLAEAIGVPLETDAFDFETLGGLILHLAGDIPQAGDAFVYERLHLTVETMEENRIRQVLVRVAPEPPVEG